MHLYLFDKCASKIKAPAMSEDLGRYDGTAITIYESAFNEYATAALLCRRY